ncbi:Protein GLB-28 [Aphelenchoides avenae]|nr:Protein GLB-28 [Aphelenchus avenae]
MSDVRFYPGLVPPSAATATTLTVHDEERHSASLTAPTLDDVANYHIRPVIMHADISQKLSMSPGTTTNQLAPRPLRRCRSASPAVPRAPLLSHEQQGLIRKSWQRMSKAAIGRAISQKLAERCPDTRSLYSDPSAMERHDRYFGDLIQSAVDNLTDMDTALKPWLETLGKGHAGFAIKSTHWDAFGEAVVAATSEWIGRGKAHRETARSWVLLASFIADRLGSASQGVPMCTPRIHLITLVSSGPSTPC